MDTTTWVYFLAAVPPEIAGLPTWALNGLSIGSLVMFLVVGLATSRLYTKRQVDDLNKQHEREVTNLTTQHSREVTNLTTRYDSHLARTIQIYQAAVDGANDREKEWRDIARSWESTGTMLAQGMEPLQDQSEAMLRIVTAWQAEFRRKGDES